ncbi:WhiB family transcriptional regulator [Streptomyces bottropensis]|uniref:WhiB family transcriptional regulator n=1 Tax=Streptomyces bottropensis TaxID=42235 RepID=UPI0036CC00D4
MNSTVRSDWTQRAACADADPDLFFPEPGGQERIGEAKQICAACPVRQECLDDAMRRGEADAICGGLTADEREQLLRPGAATAGASSGGKASARQLAVKHGAFLAQSLGQYGMSVERMSEELGSTPVSVYLAYMLLVPRRPQSKRPTRPSVLESLLETRKEQLKTLERRGVSQSEIGDVLNIPQSMVAAALAILRQREKALERMGDAGVANPLRVLRREEVRVRQEAGVGLTVDDVIQIAGRKILRMVGEGLPLRQVARDLDLNREAVRRAYQQMTSRQVVRTFNQGEMGAAA